MEMISNEEKITQAVLVSVDTGDYDAEASLAELKELVKSAGAEPVFTVTQNLKRPETGTYVGTGKFANNRKSTCSCLTASFPLLKYEI